MPANARVDSQQPVLSESAGDSQDSVSSWNQVDSVSQSDLFAFSKRVDQVREAIMVAAGRKICRKDVKKYLSTLSERRLRAFNMDTTINDLSFNTGF